MGGAIRSPYHVAAMLESASATKPVAERPAAALLSVRDLVIEFQGERGSSTVVNGISLDLFSGQTLAVVSMATCSSAGPGVASRRRNASSQPSARSRKKDGMPNECATALGILRLLPPTAIIGRGSIKFDGRDLLKLPSREMLRVRGGQIAMIFQEPMSSLNPVYSIGEQIIEAIVLHQHVAHRQAVAIAADALHEVGIPNARRRLKAYPHEFSGGMRQRVMIAMALACRPRMLLADEPTTALDVTIQAQILELLSALKRERGMGIMLITHDLGLVARHAETVCVMYAGRVMEYGPVAAVLSKPLHPYTRALLACRPSMTERKPRLKTVPEIINNPAEFAPIANGATPWWPGDQMAQNERIAEPAMIKIGPDHSVACVMR